MQIDPSAAEGKVTGVDLTTFGPEDVFVKDGETAYDALLATDVDVYGNHSFVTSIDGLEEGAAGPTSGWMYMVNEEMPMVPANEYVLEEGDDVLWYYVDSYE